MKQLIVVLLSMMPLLLCAKGDKDTRLVVITIDGLRWQEVFEGAEENILTDKKQVNDTELYRKTYWRSTPEERRQALMPFVWNTIAKQGTIIGNRNKNSMMQLANKTNISYPGYSEMMTGMVDDAIKGNDPVNNPHRNVLEAANEDARYKGSVMMYGSWKSTRFAIHNEQAGIPASVSYEKPIAKKPSPRIKLAERMLEGMPHYWRSEHFDAFTYAFAIETLLSDPTATSGHTPASTTSTSMLPKAPMPSSATSTKLWRPTSSTKARQPTSSPATTDAASAMNGPATAAAPRAPRPLGSCSWAKASRQRARQRNAVPTTPSRLPLPSPPSSASTSRPTTEQSCCQ